MRCPPAEQPCVLHKCLSKSECHCNHQATKPPNPTDKQHDRANHHKTNSSSGNGQQTTNNKPWHEQQSPAIQISSSHSFYICFPAKATLYLPVKKTTYLLSYLQSCFPLLLFILKFCVPSLSFPPTSFFPSSLLLFLFFVVFVLSFAFLCTHLVSPALLHFPIV